MADLPCLLMDPVPPPDGAHRRRWSFARRGMAVRRRSRSGGALAAVAALWLASPAVSHQEGEVEALVAAMVSIGCAIRSEAEAQQVEERTGLGHEALSAIMSRLLADGRLVLLDTMDGVRLTTAECD